MPVPKQESVTLTIRYRLVRWTVSLVLATFPVLAAHGQEPELPRPLLDVGATRNATPQPVQPSATPEPAADTAEPVRATPTPDPLEVIRKLRQWRRDNPAPIAQTPTEPASTPEVVSPLATAVPSPTATPRPTTAPSVTEEQIRSYNEDARNLFRADQKAEAQAMFRKVWESDPENKFGLSDLAYIQWCGLIVSRDDDGLRRESLARITEFESLFPGSPHLDSAVFIRATLATDLGRVDEAHRLLQDFPQRFPNSRRIPAAFQLLRDLPPLPGERRPTPTPRAAGSSTGSTAGSGGSTRPTSTAAPRRTQGLSSAQETPRPAGSPRRVRSAYDDPAPARTTPRANRPNNPVRCTPRP
jgi:hypothetical protein